MFSKIKFQLKTALYLKDNFPKVFDNMEHFQAYQIYAAVGQGNICIWQFRSTSYTYTLPTERTKNEL